MQMTALELGLLRPSTVDGSTSTGLGQPMAIILKHLRPTSAKLMERAREMFGPDIQITTEGKRHIGAALGLGQFKVRYIEDKISKWVKDVGEISEIAKEEPQAALTAFNTGLSQRWNFV